MTDLARRAAVVAAAIPVLLGIIGSLPAAADAPSPLTLTVSADGCSIVGTGTGYDELKLILISGGTVSMADADTDGEVSALYAVDYLATTGDPVTAKVDSIVAGQVVESMQTTFVPTCDAGSLVTLDVTTVGTPPNPAAAFAVTIHDCAVDSGLTVTVGVTDGAAYTVPVPLGTWCVRIHSIPSGMHSWGATPDQVVLTDAAGEHVDLVLDFASRYLTLEAFFRDGTGQLVDAAAVGVDPTAVAFQATSFDDAAQPIFTEGPCTFDAEPDVECAGLDVLGMRPNGSVVVTGGVSGWFLEQTTFLDADCTEPYAGTCLLSLVLAAIPQGSPAPPQGDNVPAPDPEPILVPEPDAGPTTTTTSTTAPTTTTSTTSPPPPASAGGGALSSFAALEIGVASRASAPADETDGVRRALPRTGWTAGPLAAGGIASIALGVVLRLVGGQMALRRSRRTARTAMP